MKKIILMIASLSFFTFSFGNNVENNENKKIKMILDLDTGIDDAMALAYALGNPNIDLIGVTTIYGNVSRDTSIENTLSLLDLLNRTDVPVYPGAQMSTNKTTPYEPYEIVKSIHGNNGLGNVILPKSKRKAEKQDAVDFIIESVNKYGKDLYIVATGPETNLAALIKKDPTIGEKVGKIVVMGGVILVEGNMSHFAEANIYNDPIAANEFYSSTTPFTMVGLDVTYKTLLTKKDTQKWRSLGTPSGKAFADIVDHYIMFETQHKPELKGCALHDPLAVAVAMHPEFVETIKLPMKVITTGEDFGRTIGDYGRLNDPNPNVEVCVGVDVDEFINNFTDTLAQLFEKN